MPTARIPLAYSLESRDGSLGQDAKLVNCFAEAGKEGQLLAVKRPGMSSFLTTTAAAAQGSYVYGTTGQVVVNDAIYGLDGAGAVSLSSPSVAHQRMSCLSTALTGVNDKYAFIKSTIDAWAVTTPGSTVTKISDVDYPSSTVSGVARLDSTYYVMDSYAQIYGSDLNNPLSWDALNRIQADRGLGRGKAITRHLNYIAAFCDNGVQFFYDAGNATGSPLSPLPNGSVMVGCASGDSIVSINNLTIFLNKDPQRGRSVSAFNGLSLLELGDPYVSRILNNDQLANVYAYGIKVSGSSFYILNLPDSNITLALCLTSRTWSVWTDTSGNYFKGHYYVNHAPSPSTNGDYILHPTSGVVYKVLPSLYQDAGSSIPVTIVTSTVDGGTMDRKFLSAVHLIGDTVSSTIGLQYSDDDYTTWSSSLSIDLSTVRKQLRRLGSFKRRAFMLTHTANTALRLESLEMHDNQE